MQRSWNWVSDILHLITLVQYVFNLCFGLSYFTTKPILVATQISRCKHGAEEEIGKLNNWHIKRRVSDHLDGGTNQHLARCKWGFIMHFCIGVECWQICTLIVFVVLKQAMTWKGTDSVFHLITLLSVKCFLGSVCSISVNCEYYKTGKFGLCKLWPVKFCWNIHMYIGS